MPVYDSGMKTLQEISDALRELGPEEIRERLLAMEREEKALRVLLRAAIVRQGKTNKTEARHDD